MVDLDLRENEGDDLTAATRSGIVRGVREGGVAAFHAVPYAAPPVGALRFAPPQDHASWSGVRDCSRPGPSAPQNASRLDAVMGVATFSQSEDCLYLDIWTPSPDQKKRPVFVWLHGGAYMSGGGNQSFYTGARLAARGDMVVVSVTYRIGVLGYLYLPGIESEGGAPANRGLLDQAHALQWIHNHIHLFGGDPANVTVAGQSAGAGSLLALLTHAGAVGHIHKGIVQSSAGSNLTEEEGREVARLFFTKAGLTDGDVARARAMEVADILTAQGAVVAEYATRPTRTLPWQLISGRPELPDMPATAVARGASPTVPLIFGWTLNEMHAWYAQDLKLVAAPTVAELKGFPVGASLTAEACRDLERKVGAGQMPWEALAELHTEQVFGSTAKRIADQRAEHGCETWVYRFDWSPTRSARYGACHCIEIPFVFDNVDDWPAPPMLEGADPAAVRRVTDVVQSLWISFARSGKPSADGLATWPARSSSQRAVMILDDPTHLAV